jgi:hypothetical protein
LDKDATQNKLFIYLFIYFVFSCAGNVVANKRCRLTAETINMLVTLSHHADCIEWEMEAKQKAVPLTVIVCSVIE